MQKSLLENLDVLLISNPWNIRYLTGFIGAAPEEREAYVLVTPQTLWLFTNSLYLESARKSNEELRSKKQEVQIQEISREHSLTSRIAEILLTPTEVKESVSLGRKEIKLGFEDTHITVAEYNQLHEKLTNITLVPTRNRVEALRTYKTAAEITNIKRAAQLTDDCFTHLLSFIKPGMTETHIAWEILTFFNSHGAESAFSPIVAFNEHSSMPHYSPTHHPKLKSASLVLLDFGAKVNGYCADMTRIIFVGKPMKEWEDAYKGLAAAQQAALDLLNSGERSGAKLDTEVREVLEKHALPTYPHSLGHGLGIEIHEHPRLTFKQDELLKPGMVFTIEPGMYMEGKFGMRIEDTVCLDENNHVQILTKSSKEITII